MVKKLAGSAVVACSMMSGAFAADVVVTSNQVLELTDVGAGIVGDTWTVLGELTVAASGVFSPAQLVLDGDGTDMAVNVEDPTGLHFRGRTFLNGGLMTIGSVSINSTSQLFINNPDTVSLGTLTNGNVLNINGPVSINTGEGASSGALINSGQVTLSNNNTVNAVSFSTVDTGQPLALRGSGTVVGGSISLADPDTTTGTFLEPGDSTTAGTLTLTSGTAVSFANSLVDIGVFNDLGGFSHDLVRLNGTGQLDGGLLLIDFSTFSAAELEAHGPFTILEGTALEGELTVVDPSALEFREGGDLVGWMQMETTATSVQFTYVPEPTSLALIGLGAVGLLRRRRA